MNRYISRRKHGHPQSQNSCVKNQNGTTEYSPAPVRRRRNPVRAALPGSMTLEAAIALPVCMLILMSFLLFFQVMAVQLSVRRELSDTDRLIAAGCSVKNTTEESEDGTDGRSLSEELLYYAASETVLKAVMNRKLNDEIAGESVIRGGLSGISYAGSHYDRNTERVVLQATYRIGLPFDISNRIVFRLTDRVVRRAWTGKEYVPGEKEDVVYITETGKVYHTSRDCTYLRLSIQTTDRGSVAELRNADGGKYYPCELCADEPGGGTTVYVTDQGDRYHYNKNCSGLKRTVMSVPLSEVGDRKKCSRCREKGAE